MHVCKHCKHVQDLLAWVSGRCKKCLKVGCITWVALTPVCPVTEKHDHAPEPDTIQQGTVGNEMSFGASGSISGATPFFLNDETGTMSASLSIYKKRQEAMIAAARCASGFVLIPNPDPFVPAPDLYS